MIPKSYPTGSNTLPSEKPEGTTGFAQVTQATGENIQSGAASLPDAFARLHTKSLDELLAKKIAPQIKIVRDLMEQQGFTDIPSGEIRLMASSLKYLNISNTEKATEYNIKIIPPSPIFHTWIAFNGNSFFDGSNNKKGLNYIEKLRKESEYLAPLGIPVFVVYSNSGMDSSEITKIKDIDSENKNVIFLCIEEDLPDLFMHSPLSELDFDCFLDGIRLFVIANHKEILVRSKNKAVHSGKNELADRFEQIGNRSICYSDFDNIFINKPKHILAMDGIAARSIFTPETIAFNKRNQYPPAIAFREYAKYIRNKEMSREDMAASAEKYSNYIFNEDPNFFEDIVATFSGEYHKKPEFPKSYQYWTSDNSFIRAIDETLDIFNALCSSLSLYTSSIFEFNSYEDERQALTGTQLINEVIMGEDSSWTLTSNNEYGEID